MSWMERYIKNDKKSIMGMNRLHEAHKKSKQVRTEINMAEITAS